MLDQKLQKQQTCSAGTNWSTTCKPIKDHLEKISSIVGFDVKPDVSMLLQKHIWYVCDSGEPNKLESGVNWVT